MQEGVFCHSVVCFLQLGIPSYDFIFAISSAVIVAKPTDFKAGRIANQPCRYNPETRLRRAFCKPTSCQFFNKVSELHELLFRELSLSEAARTSERLTDLP